MPSAETISTWTPLIVTLAPLVITFIGYLITAIRKKTAETTVANLEVDAAQRAFFNQLVQFGIDFAINKTKSTTASAAFVTTVVDYVTKNGPDVVNHFKLSAEKLADIVSSRLQGRVDVDTGVSTPAVETATTTVVVTPPASVEATAEAAARLLGLNPNLAEAGAKLLKPTL